MADHCHSDPEDCSEDQWFRETLLVKQWEQMKHEILLHKWYESERAGHDIGWDRAAFDWMLRFNKRESPSNS